MSMEEGSHNPEDVVNEANEKFANNDLAGAQMVYQSALLEWVDDASFGESNPVIVKHISDGVAKLWIEFVKLLRKANMFKSATDTFEAAVNCPIAGTKGIVWKEYAKFQQDRNKNKTAQKIYLRALVGDGGNAGLVTGAEDQDMLWEDFLSMMRRLNNDDGLSLQQLKDAVLSEHTFTATQAKVKAEPAFETGGGLAMETAPGGPSFEVENPAKRAKLDEIAYRVPEAQILSASTIEATSMELYGRAKDLPAEITAEWLAKDGDTPPSRPPPLFNPSPPRLSDPSGSDLLGTEISLKLIKLIIGGADGFMGGAILDICRGCWMMTALKEREARECTEALDKKLTDDVERMDTDLEARLSVAGAALVAVQQMNAAEKMAFLASCNQQRQHLQSLIAWEFRELLATQQQILTSAGIPEFDGATASSLSIYKQSAVCSFLHSAFFLRNRIGEEAHLAMLKSQETKLSTQQATPMPLPPGMGQDEPMPPFVPQPSQFPQQGSYPPPYGHPIQYQ